MKNVLVTLVCGCMFCLSGSKLYAPDDRKGDPLCTSCSHACLHKYPCNLSRCPGAPVGPECIGQDAANCPAGGTQYYTVMWDFPIAECDDITTTCIDSTPSASHTYSVYASHTKIDSPPANCYRTAICRWDTESEPEVCVIHSAGPIVNAGKKTASVCPPCL